MYSKLVKYVERPIHFQGTLRKQAILIADSKGNYLKPHADLIEQFGYHIEFECRSGARFADYYYWLQSNLYRKVQQFGHIILYIFLGTCDLTTRKGKFIDLRQDDDNKAFYYLKFQIDRYLHFISKFPTVSVVFLEIPPYSIQTWNSSRGHRDPSTFCTNDKILNERIILVNDYIKAVNENRTHPVHSPRFNLDLKRYRKAKGDKHSKSSLTFANYKDGIHPTPLLSRVWLKRIILLILKDCA